MRGAYVRGYDGDAIPRGDGGGDRAVVAMLTLRGSVHKVSMSDEQSYLQCLTVRKESAVL